MRYNGNYAVVNEENKKYFLKRTTNVNNVSQRDEATKGWNILIDQKT